MRICGRLPGGVSAGYRFRRWVELLGFSVFYRGGSGVESEGFRGFLLYICIEDKRGVMWRLNTIGVLSLFCFMQE